MLETDRGPFLLVSLRIPTLVSFRRRGLRLQTEQTRPCECVIRIVNEVNSSAHLTSLQLSLVQHHGTLRCYIMGNDWLQILHQSTRERKDWCFFLFMLILLLLDLCLCWGQFYDQAGGIECKQTKIYPWKIKDPATGTCKKNIAAASTVLGASCFSWIDWILWFCFKISGHRFDQ